MTDSAFKVCPFCKEQIRQEAVKCRFCGEWLKPSTEKPKPDSSQKLTTTKPVLPLPTPPQETYRQQRPANLQNKTTPKANATTRTGTKSAWRLAVGMLLLAAVSNNLLHNLPNDPGRHDLTYVITYLVVCLLLAA